MQVKQHLQLKYQLVTGYSIKIVIMDVMNEEKQYLLS